jgi:hypothetical protein
MRLVQAPRIIEQHCNKISTYIGSRDIGNVMQKQYMNDENYTKEIRHHHMMWGEICDVSFVYVWATRVHQSLTLLMHFAQ